MYLYKNSLLYLFSSLSSSYYYLHTDMMCRCVRSRYYSRRTFYEMSEHSIANCDACGSLLLPYLV